MKILLVHQNFPGQFRGLAPALIAAGHELRAISMRQETTLAATHRVWRTPGLAADAVAPLRGLSMWSFVGNRLSDATALSTAWQALPEAPTEAPTLQDWARTQGWNLPLALRNTAWLAKVGLVQTDVNGAMPAQGESRG